METQETPLEEQPAGKEIILEEEELEREEKPKIDPLSTEPPPEHPRFKQVYAKWKDTERKIEELSKDRDADKAVMDEMRRHNQALMGKLEEISSKAIESMESGAKSRESDSEIATIQTRIGFLEDQKAQAVENLQGKEVARIDREIRQLEKKLDSVQVEKSKPKETAKPRETQQDIDPVIQTWIGETEWFHKDPIMTGAAKELDFVLSTNPKWKDKPTKDRLEEVRRVVEQTFNWGKTKKPSASGAESGSGLQKTTVGQKTVRLSDAELRVAKGLGITPEDYAKQKVFLGGV